MTKKKDSFKKIIKFVCFFLIFEIVSIFLIISLLHDNQTATTKNTEVISGKIESITMWGSDPTEKSLHIIVNSQQFSLMRTRTDDTHNISSLRVGDTVTVTAKKSYDLLSFRNDERDIVDLRNEETIYYDICDYNSSARWVSIIGTIVLSIFWCIGTGIFILTIMIYWKLRKN